MSKIFFIICALSFVSGLGAHERVKLPDYYFLQVEKPGIEPQFVKKHDENVMLNPGSYTLSTPYMNIDFEINENGMVHGDATCTSKRHPDYISYLQYENGLIIKSQTINTKDSTILSETELRDSVLSEKIFYQSGKLKQVKTTDFNIKSPCNTIRTSYYENGQLEAEDNNIADTFKGFYENGNPERFMDDANGIMIFYKIDGTIDWHSYKEGDSYCRDDYRNGKIETKECTSEKEFRHYFYVDGKLSHYSVYDNATHKTIYYNAAGVQIEKQGQEEIFPEIIINQ